MKHIARIKRTTLAIGMALLLSIVTTPSVSAAELQLSNVPLFTELKVEPNVVVSLDDSGSMRRCFILDEAIGKGVVEEELGMTANAVNALAYNPNIAYLVPVDGNGVTLGIPPFTDAWEDGYNKGDKKKNLQSKFEP
ncbi:MAG: hypothetical protein V3R83_11460, partial [Gammaproteobacteria bacterium]